MLKSHQNQVLKATKTLEFITELVNVIYTYIPFVQQFWKVAKIPAEAINAKLLL